MASGHDGIEGGEGRGCVEDQPQPPGNERTMAKSSGDAPSHTLRLVEDDTAALRSSFR